MFSKSPIHILTLQIPLILHQSVVQILEMIQALLPHVSAVNLLVPSNEEPAPATTPHYYTWVESEHPYKQAAVSNMRWVVRR